MPAICEALPTPMVPTAALSGFALSHAINSLRSFAGMAFFATMTLRLGGNSGGLVRIPTGSYFDRVNYRFHNVLSRIASARLSSP